MKTTSAASSNTLSTRGESLPSTTTKSKDLQVKNSFMILTFDGATGKLKTMENRQNGVKTNVTFDLLFYKSHDGNNSKVTGEIE